jgi:hypothetical protein
MDDERFLNSYHNASTPPGPDVPADLAGFMLAADPVLGEAAELSRVLARAHWLAVPLIGSDGDNYGFIQVSDRLEGDFTAQDEANLLRLASLIATALDALAQLHLPEYRAKVVGLGQ